MSSSASATRVGPVKGTGLVIGTMCAAVVLIIAAVAALSPVLSTIGAALTPTQSQLQWIVDAFALTLAALLLPMGGLGDRFGRKKMMVAGFAIFVVAALWGVTTESVEALIASRALGGVGAAMIFPGTLSTLTATMPEHKRAFAISLWTASASLGGTIGMLASGALVEFFAYTSVFVFLAVAGLAIGAMTVIAVPETSDPAHSHVDPVGSVLSVLGVGGLVFAVIEGPVKGWTDPVTFLGFAAAIIGLVGFALWELRSRTPLLDVRLFRLPGFSTGFSLVFVQFFVVFGFFFVAAQYLGFVRGYTPFQIAAALLPVGILLPVMSLFAPKWSKRWGRGPIGGSGLVLMAIATSVFALSDSDSNYWIFAAALTVFGAGMGLSGPPGTEAIVEALPAEKQGVASAINDVSRELGGAVGIAIIGSALTSGYRRGIDDSAAALEPGLRDAVRDSASAGLSLAAEAGPAQSTIVATIEVAFVEGFSIAMITATAVLALGAVYVWLKMPKAEPTAAVEHNATTGALR